MFNNTNTMRRIVLASAGMLLTVALWAMADSYAPKTYMDYPEWNLLPKGEDYDDENEIAAFRQLMAEGPAAHEAMLAIVRECDDSMIVGRALAVLRASSGDTRPVVVELKREFERRFPRAVGEEAQIANCLAAAIADLGTEEDANVLIPMLTHPYIRMRIMGARYYGKLCGGNAIEVLEGVKTRYSEERFLQEVDAVIADIESRQAEKDAPQDAEASPSP